METLSSFGYWVRRRRKALDLTQDVLARQVGCAKITIQKIEADERRPSRQIAERLADCLAVRGDERTAFLQAARSELRVERLAPPAEHPVAPPPPAKIDGRSRHIVVSPLIWSIGHVSFFFPQRGQDAVEQAESRPRMKGRGAENRIGR